MSAKRTDTMNAFLSIGECMLEFSRRADGAWSLGYAGDTLNTAWYFRALAPQASWETRYFTRLGNDVHSAGILAFLEENGIGTGHIARDPDRQPGLYLIDTKDGERSFTYWRSQSAARLLADDEAALETAIGEAAIVYFSGITLAILAPDRRAALIAMAETARAAGKLTVFDPNIRPRLWETSEAMREAIMAAAGACAIVLPSFDDEKTVFGDNSLAACAARYRKAGAETVVVKNGGGDMLFAGPDGTQDIDGLERVVPVDTTGAGDSFNGAWLAARAAGQGPADAARFAHSVSARVIRHPGALMTQAALADIGFTA